jgi:hypothetical protein
MATTPAGTLVLSNMDICILQLACVDRMQNLRGLIQSAEARKDDEQQSNLATQVERVEDLLARLVRL